MSKTISPDTQTEKDKSESENPIMFVDIFLDPPEVLHFTNEINNTEFYDLDGVLQTYYSLKMNREQKTETIDMSIQTIKCQLDNIDQGMSAYASKSLRNRKVVIRACFRNLLGSADNAWKVFDGFLNNPKWTVKNFVAELYPRLGRGTLDSKIGVKQQLSCRLPFAGTKCAHDIAPTVLKDEKTGQTVDSATTAYIIDAERSEADDYWNAGYVTFAADTLTVNLRSVSREIKDFIAAEYKIMFKIALPVAPQTGDTYKIERGCDLTLESCQNKFSNEANFGGIHTLPAMMVKKG